MSVILVAIVAFTLSFIWFTWPETYRDPGSVAFLSLYVACFLVAVLADEIRRGRAT